MLTLFVTALLFLGTLTLIKLVSFIISEVVSAICNWLRERNYKKKMLLPRDTYNEVIGAVREKNPRLADTLGKAMNDNGDEEDCKMGFAFDSEGNIKEASKVVAGNSADDDIDRVTNIFATGKYIMYA